MKQPKRNRKALRMLAQHKYRTKLLEFVKGFGIEIVSNGWWSTAIWANGECASKAYIELSVVFDETHPKLYEAAYGK